MGRPDEDGWLEKTFVLTDVEGSTRLWESDQSVARAVLDRHEQIIEDELVERDGRRPRDQGEGDSVLAVFDDADAAIGFALAVQRRLTIEPWPQGVELRVRMGAHSGPAELVRGNYKGPTVIRAARVRDLAHGGQLLVSAAVTDRLVDRPPQQSTFRAMGTHRLKGLGEPEAIYQVCHPDLDPDFPPLRSFDKPASDLPAGCDVELPAPLAAAGRGAFVGRDAELAALRQALDASAGVSGVVAIGGEAGIGKSRLVSEFCAQVHSADVTVLFGRCDRQAVRAYQPLAEALTTYVAACGGADALEYNLGRTASTLASLVPDLQKFARRRTSGARERIAEPDDARAVLFDAVTEVFTALVAQRPTVLVIDDLHWGDAASLALLGHLVWNVPRDLVVCATYRDTAPDHGADFTAAFGELARHSGFRRVSMGGLDSTAVGGLITLLDPAGPALDGGVADELVRQTGGNPLFIAQLVRQDRSGEASVFRASSGGLLDAIHHRLEALPAEVLRLLRHAAVIGPVFEAAVIEAAMPIDPDAALDALELCIEARLLIEEPGSVGAFSFSHGLVQEVLYDELSSLRACRMHAAVAEALERKPGMDDARLIALARHYAEAVGTGDAAKAVSYALRAAEAAMERTAWEQALACLQRALTIVERGSAPDLVAAVELRLRAIEPTAHLGLMDRSLELAGQAVDQAQRTGDAELFARAAEMRFAVEFHGMRRVTAEGVRLVNEALTQLEDGDAALRSTLLSDRAIAELFPEPGRIGDAASGIRHAEQAVAEADRAGDAQAIAVALAALVAVGTPHLPGARRAQLVERLDAVAVGTGRSWPQIFAAQQRVHLLLETGDPAFAPLLERLAEPTSMQRYLEERGPLSTLSSAHRPQLYSGLAMEALLRGRLDEAEGCVQRVMQHATDHNEADVADIGYLQLLMLRYEQGRVAELLPLVEPMLASDETNAGFVPALLLCLAATGRAQETWSRVDDLAADRFGLVPRDHTMLASLFALGEVCARSGHSQAAAELIPLLEPFAGTMVIVGIVGLCPSSVDRVLGQAHALQGAWAAAEGHYTRALELELGLDAMPLAARTRYWYAHMLVQRGRSDDARAARDLVDAGLVDTIRLGMTGLTRELVELRRNG